MEANAPSDGEWQQEEVEDILIEGQPPEVEIINPSGVLGVQPLAVGMVTRSRGVAARTHRAVTLQDCSSDTDDEEDSDGYSTSPEAVGGVVPGPPKWKFPLGSSASHLPARGKKECPHFPPVRQKWAIRRAS